MDDFTEISSVEELETAATEANDAANAILDEVSEGESLSPTQRAEVARLFDRRDAARARITEVQAAEAEQAAADEALRGRRDNGEPAEPTPTDAPAQPVAEDNPAEPVEPAEPADAGEPVAVAAGVDSEAIAAAVANALVAAGVVQGDRAPVTTQDRNPNIPRAPQVRPAIDPDAPLVPAHDSFGASTALVATGTVRNVSIGAELTWESAAQALVERFQAYPKPNGNGESMDLQMMPLFAINVDRPEEFRLTGDQERDQEIISFALDQSRLQGRGEYEGQVGLVAAGGWCAPSTVMYDIPVVGESMDGMVSIPEVAAPRGGVSSTTGPDFAALYAAIGFHQTEAQAIAGTAKTCYEVPCPSFTETRLDVEGVCIKVPILTEAGYPELIRRYLSGAAVVHGHKMNAFKLTKMEAASTAVDTTSDGLGSTAFDTFSALALRASVTRYKYRMTQDALLEVVLPLWVRDWLKFDLSLRPGADPTKPITDAVLNAHFAAANLSVQYVYDWQDVADPHGAGSFPTTFKALIYPAGTFLGLTKDVINLSSVYDAASLAVNTYTGTFSEEGIGVRKMSGVSEVVTIPICSKGTVGATEFTCTTTP